MTAINNSLADELKSALLAVTQQLGEDAAGLVQRSFSEVHQNVLCSVVAAETGVSDVMKYEVPTEDTKIACKYTLGVNSIIASVPDVEPEIVEGFGAVIPVKKLVNLIVALNVPIKRFDNDADWTKDNNGNYDGAFYRNCHEKIKAMKRKRLLPEALCVYFLKCWADAFQACAIADHSEYNSVQLHTLTVLAPKGKQTKYHTLPFAIGFK